MAELTVDLTYGSALFSAAGELDIKEQIMDEGSWLIELFKTEQELAAYMSDPAVPAAEKKTALTKIFEGRICREMLNLIFVLVDKGRSRHFPGIIRVYNDLLNREEGVSYGKIYSAAELSSEQLLKLEQETSELMKVSVKLENLVDPTLIGGVKILVDGHIIDATLRKRLDDLANSFS